MAQNEDAIERTLAIFKEVSAYTIPPRMGSGGDHNELAHASSCMEAISKQLCGNMMSMHLAGVKSGSWRIEDRIFTGHLMVVDCGEVCELRLTDGNTCAAAQCVRTERIAPFHSISLCAARRVLPVASKVIAGHRGELFAMCPLRVGERMACVEPAADSSRNFVVRVVDATSKRHAFLGMGFPERDDAFDFNVALSDWEKHLQGAADSVAAAAAAPQHDFSLKAGETIKVKPIASKGAGGGLMSSMAALGPDSSSSAGGAGLLAPPMPASATSGSASTGLLPPVPAPAGGLLPPPPAGISVSSSAPNSNANSSPSSQVRLIAQIVPCKLLQCGWLLTAS